MPMKGHFKGVSRLSLLTVTHSLAHRVNLFIYRVLQKSVSSVRLNSINLKKVYKRKIGILTKEKERKSMDIESRGIYPHNAHKLIKRNVENKNGSFQGGWLCEGVRSAFCQ